MAERPSRAAAIVDAGVKVALVALLAFGAFSGLQQFEGKAFGSRLIAYPLAVMILPVVWWIESRRGARGAFPAFADALITMPFFIDVAGNAFDLYDTVEWWDDANHFVNWALLSGGVGLLVVRARLPRWALATITLGFGGVSAIGWEIAEYYAFIRNSDELATAYTDTLGDLALGTLGACVAATLVALRPRPGG